MRIIGGKYKNRLIYSPKGEETRPTSSLVREAVFNICQSFIEDAALLDLYAGSGAMGLEALSRGAGWVTFVDQNRHAIKAIQKNLSTLNVSGNYTILRGEVLKVLRDEFRIYDVVYADPPYHLPVFEELLKFFDSSFLLREGGYLFIEQGLQNNEINLELKNLTLKSQRKLGKTLLFQFLRV